MSIKSAVRGDGKFDQGKEYDMSIRVFDNGRVGLSFVRKEDGQFIMTYWLSPEEYDRLDTFFNP